MEHEERDITEPLIYKGELTLSDLEKIAAEYEEWDITEPLIYEGKLKPSDLAKIAAPLAVGKSRSQYLEVAQEAFELWKACEAKLEQIGSELRQAVDERDKKVFGLKNKDSYTLTELLKYAFPKVRTVSERFSRFRVFLDYHLRQLRAKETEVPINEVPKISLNEKNKFLEKLREDGLTQDSYLVLHHAVRDFNYLKRRERAAKAGKASGKKRKK